MEFWKGLRRVNGVAWMIQKSKQQHSQNGSDRAEGLIGMMLFTLGAELAMTPMGEKVGTKMANSGRIWIVFFLCFFLGFVITISEPDRRSPHPWT